MKKTSHSALAGFAVALIMLLGASAGAVGPSIWFDFEPAEPDQDGFFGTHQPAGTFDDQSSAGSFQVTSAKFTVL